MSNTWVMFHDMSIAHRVAAGNLELAKPDPDPNKVRLLTECGCAVHFRMVRTAHPSVRRCQQCGVHGVLPRRGTRVAS